MSTTHCPECRKSIRYHGERIYALIVHMKINHIGWTYQTLNDQIKDCR